MSPFQINPLGWLLALLQWGICFGDYLACVQAMPFLPFISLDSLFISFFSAPSVGGFEVPWGKFHQHLPGATEQDSPAPSCSNSPTGPGHRERTTHGPSPALVSPALLSLARKRLPPRDFSLIWRAPVGAPAIRQISRAAGLVEED